MTIFVQIASYRDPQLIPTIEDMLRKAKNPQNLRIGICNQYHPEDKFNNLEKYKKDFRFRILDVPYGQSRGACWARNMIQQTYMGETYTLQIDSHMRFVKNWDETLINMLRGLQAKGFKKPILTTYVAHFNPYDANQKFIDEPPLQMNFYKFTEEGVVVFQPDIIPNWKKLTAPVPARFYAAGFSFTIGAFCREVPHDRDYYFIGEEISIAVRAYTNGYDLFHPHKNLLWHYYTRKNSKRHWDDHKNWFQRDNICYQKNRELLSMENAGRKVDFGKYGLGKVRTVRDYEKYAGILFSKRGVQRYTLECRLPPNPRVFPTEKQWFESFYTAKKYCLEVESRNFTYSDYDFWVVAFHDEKDQTIFRDDANRQEIERIRAGNKSRYQIIREFYSVKPKYWVLWPHSKTRGWCKRLTGNF